MNRAEEVLSCPYAVWGLGVEVVCDLTSIVLCKYERLVAPSRLRYRRGRHDAGVSPTSGNLTPIACLPNSISIVTMCSSVFDVLSLCSQLPTVSLLLLPTH